MPVVLPGCETWSLSSKDEPRLKVFENRVTKRIYGLYSDEVTKKCRRLHKEELNDFATVQQIPFG